MKRLVGSKNGCLVFYPVFENGLHDCREIVYREKRIKSAIDSLKLRERDVDSLRGVLDQYIALNTTQRGISQKQSRLSVMKLLYGYKGSRRSKKLRIQTWEVVGMNCRRRKKFGRW
ncbi:MAG: hypothetical protein ACLTZT_00295 [Butyricimonas faecalis]